MIGAPDTTDAFAIKVAYRLAGLPQLVRVALVGALVAAAIVADWRTGPATSMVFVYSVATVLAAWMFVQRWPAIFVALAVSVGSALIGVTAPDSPITDRVVWLNAGFRASTLVVLGAVVSAFRRHLIATSRMAVTDPLTGVLNRRATLTELADAVGDRRHSAGPTTVIYFDLDGLKAVNDRDGHEAGDGLIRAFVTAVGEHVRPSDRLGRLGGDEFLLICPNSTAVDAEGIVGRIIDAPGTPQVSWGACSSDDLDDPAAMIAAADERMFASKRQRRSTST